MRKGGEPWWLSLGWHLFGLGGVGPFQELRTMCSKKGRLALGPPTQGRACWW